MECHACEIIHVLGPYVLFAIFAIFLCRLVRRHREQFAQMHSRTMDVFERQNATYERVHFDLVALNKGSDKVHGSLDADTSTGRKR